MEIIKDILKTTRTAFAPDGKTLYCLRDVLGYLSLTYNSRLNDRLKGCIYSAPLETGGGAQTVKFVTLEGLLRLVFRSNKKDAITVQDSICALVASKFKSKCLLSDMPHTPKSAIELDRIYNEDCLVGMQRIPDKSIDCIICDLPYNTTALEWDEQMPMTKLWQHYKRIIKDNGAIILFGSEPFSSRVRMSMIEWYRYDWVWVKNRPTGFQHAKNKPLKEHENIMVFSPYNASHNVNGMKYNPQGLEYNPCIRKSSMNKWGSIVGVRPSHKDEYAQEYSNYPRSVLYFAKDKKSLHPTQKPMALIEYLVRTYTNEGDTVLDNCMGSGTTAIACINTNRHYIGFELSKDYYNVAVQRIADPEFADK